MFARSKGGLIVPLPPEEIEKARARALAHSEELRRKYDSDPVLKEQADQLHHRRMMPGDACDQCIEAVLNRTTTQ